MKIIVDTREHPNAIEKLIAYFDNVGVSHEHKKLDVGDYQIEGKPNLVIDRKRNLRELVQNLGSDNGRFMREIRRAAAQGIKLVVLCEHGGTIHSIQDVASWRNPSLDEHPNAMTGRELAERMYRVHIAYGVEFLFCDKRSTGRRIIEILSEENNGGKE